jgi:hypothetical protein
MSDSQTNPIPTNFEIAHPALPMGVDPAPLARYHNIDTGVRLVFANGHTARKISFTGLETNR